MHQWRSGKGACWFFGVNPDGSVSIQARASHDGGSPLLASAIIPQDEFLAILDALHAQHDHAPQKAVPPAGAVELPPLPPAADPEPVPGPKKKGKKGR